MSQNKMQIESIMFDWRLYAERGLPSYIHHHDDGKRIDQCEISFLNKMLAEKSFANMNLNADQNDEANKQMHHHRHHHILKSNLSKKNQFSKVVTIDNLQNQLPIQTPGIKCDYCGKLHCDQPNHPACQQQQKLCEEEQRLNQIKQQQYQEQINRQQQQLNQQFLQEQASRPDSQPFCKSTSPDFSHKTDQFNSSQSRSQQYTIQTGNTSFECTGAIRKAGFLSVKKWLLRKRQHVELARKRGWKCYWTCLKGTTLLFYQCNFIDNLSLDKSGALQLNPKVMQQIVSGERASSFAINVDQLRPYSSKSNDTLGDFEENLYENLAVCTSCVHCSRCNRVINNESNAIYQNSVEANVILCLHCSQGHPPTIDSGSQVKCLCECHQRNEANKKSNSFVQQIAYQPKHLILIDNSIVQPIPEHPKRYNVFCLSTAIGDAYLFQAPCENENNNWINAIQSACAASISRNKGKSGTLLKLQNEIITIQQRIDKCNRKKLNIESQIDIILEQQQRQQINISQTIRQQQQYLETEQKQQQQHLAQLVQLGQISEKQMQQQLISLSKKKQKLLEMAENGQFSDATLDDLMKQTSESNKNLIKQFNNQINQIEKQMESFYCEQFRLRCYVASIQYNVHDTKGIINSDAELPNPKTLLSHVTKSTKQILNKLGIFNVSSFHAYTCARSPQILTSVLWNHSQQMQPATNQLNSQQQPLVYLHAADRHNLPSSVSPGVNIGKQQIAQQLSKIASNRTRINSVQTFKAPTDDRHHLHKPTIFKSGQMRIQLILPPPANTIHQIVVDPHQTIEQLIQSVLKQHHDRQLELIERKQAQLDLLKQKHSQQQQLTNEYFACCKYLNNEEYFVPNNKVTLSSLPMVDYIQIVPKQLFSVDFERQNTDTLFGFSLDGQCINEQLLNEAFLTQNKRELTESNGQTGQSNGSPNMNNTKLVVYVSKVEKGSLAEKEGLKKGDELVLINGTLVSELDMMFIESVLQEELRLSLLLRAVRFEEALQVNRKTSTVTNRKFSSLNDERAQTLNRKNQRKGDEKNRLKDELIDELNQYNNRYSDDYIDSLIVQPPPKECDLSEELIDKLIIPKPDNLFDIEDGDLNKNLAQQAILSQLNFSDNLADDLMNKMNKTIQQVKEELSQHDDLIDELNRELKADTIDDLDRTSGLKLIDEDFNEEFEELEEQLLSKQSNNEINKRNISKTTSCLEMSSILNAQKEDWESITLKLSKRQYSLTEAEKVNKVINELLETEVTYVKHLDKLVEFYIKPIKKQEILSSLDILSLFGNMIEVIDFQKNTFLALLQQCINKYLPECEPARIELDVYKEVLVNISKLFLYNTHQFRKYSTYCSAHFKSQKLLFSNNKDTHCANYELIDFVKKRSKGEKGLSLESYLIKPIQRILKYPLLLQQLKNSVQSDTEEFEYLSAAHQAMENVAVHINEMQRINEEYGHILDNLQRSHYKSTKQLIALGPCDLLYQDEVGWSNLNDFLGKLKKGLDLYSMCFVYKSAVIFFCIERNRNKKKNINHRNEFLETVRYQILMPINEIQVRAIKNKSELLGNKSNESNEDNKDSNLFYWELIHLKCSLINTNTQKRSEKVFQLFNSSITFRNVFLRNIRKLIRESVKKLHLPSKTSLSQESVDSIGFSSKEELNDEDSRPDLEFISKLGLDDLKHKQRKLGYFNSITLMQHLTEHSAFEDEDKSEAKSCASEKN